MPFVEFLVKHNRKLKSSQPGGGGFKCILGLLLLVS